MDLQFTYDHSKTYVIGVSGGPDSMALFSLLNQEEYHLLVCFVNYHTRKESDDEERMVKAECTKKNIPFYRLDASFPEKGNFESWARKIRYSFFRKVYLENNCEGLFIAHHKDDLIETYLMQKKRKNIVKQYGFNEKTQIMNMNVIRPLLHIEKKDLISYCDKNNIPYSIDSTNLEDVHERNKIRHSMVEKMTSEDKERMVQEIEKENLRIDQMNLKFTSLLPMEKIPLGSFVEMSEEEKQRFLYAYITSHCDSLKEKMSWTRLHEIEKIILGSKPNACLPLDGTHVLQRNYEFFSILKNKNPELFVYKMDYPDVLDTPEFSCDFRTDTSFLKITDKSYPLIFRNAKYNDTVTFGNTTKKMNRIFIDEKIPLEKRMTYPVVEDCNGKVVYIPLYRSDIQKNIAHKLRFMIK